MRRPRRAAGKVGSGKAEKLDGAVPPTGRITAVPSERSSRGRNARGWANPATVAMSKRSPTRREHQAERGSWTDQRPARANTMLNPAESAKPPSPVQPGRRRHFYERNRPVAFGATPTHALHLDYGGLQVAGPQSRRCRKPLVRRGLRDLGVEKAGGSEGPPPPSGALQKCGARTESLLGPKRVGR